MEYHSRHVVYNSIRRGLSPLPICCPHTSDPYIHFYTPLRSPSRKYSSIPPPPHHIQLTSYRHPSTPHTTHPEETTQPSSIHPSPAPLHTPPPPRKEPTACQSYRESQTRVVGSSQHHNNLRRRLGTCPRPLPTNSRCWWFKPHSSRQPRPHHKHITSTAYIQLVRPPHYSTITITTTTTFIKQIITQYVHLHPRLELSNSGRFQSLLGDEEKGYNKSPRFLVVRLS